MASDKPSAVEIFKQDSSYLRGEIGEELQDENPHFGKGSVQLLKHHGTYQQDDRDVRGGKAADGKSQKSYIFMVRSRLPGGRLTSDQLLAELDLCEEIGNTTLRITSRQGLQLHGVVKSDLAACIGRINEVQLSTLGACGDVNRNVMCCPAPLGTPIHQAVQKLALDVALHFAPRTSAYHDLWLTDVSTGDRQQLSAAEGVAAKPGGDDVEPIYGKLYLPRKFKIGVGFPHDNCVDLYTHDLGLMAVVEGDQVIGYNVLVGGGQGMTPAIKKTFPALGHRLGFVTPDDVLDAATAVVKVQRDHGNRSDRKVARMKYLIHNWGLPRFRETVEQYFGKPLDPPHDAEVHEFDDHIGWHEQADGRWFYGLNVENGRIHDTDQMQLKTAVRQICSELKPSVNLTSHQSVLFGDLPADSRDQLTDILDRHGVVRSERISQARRWSMACVAWPTCGLSITESERALPGLIDQLEVELERLGLEQERFTIRMTGCPNGCARPYNSDIGLVGKSKGKYTLYLGGRLLGDRLSFVFRDQVPAEDVVPLLSQVFTLFKDQRQTNESFGDFCHRLGAQDLEQQLVSHAS